MKKSGFTIYEPTDSHTHTHTQREREIPKFAHTIQSQTISSLSLFELHKKGKETLDNILGMWMWWKVMNKLHCVLQCPWSILHEDSQHSIHSHPRQCYTHSCNLMNQFQSLGSHLRLANYQTFASLPLHERWATISAWYWTAKRGQPQTVDDRENKRGTVEDKHARMGMRKGTKTCGRWAGQLWIKEIVGLFREFGRNTLLLIKFIQVNI